MIVVLEIALYLFIGGLVVMLSAYEVFRYRQANLDDTDLPYPRKRLIRRIGSAVLVLMLLMVIALEPDEKSVYASVVWVSICIILALLLIMIAFRDMRETSIAVVGENERFYREMEAQLKSGDLNKTGDDRNESG